jgi:hypothetical protein
MLRTKGLNFALFLQQKRRCICNSNITELVLQITSLYAYIMQISASHYSLQPVPSADTNQNLETYVSGILYKW